MRHLSVSGLSIMFALLLALWEVYFFGFAGEHGLFTSERLGFNIAWLTWAYLSFQLISIPFALPTARTRFIGVLDGPTCSGAMRSTSRSAAGCSTSAAPSRRREADGASADQIISPTGCSMKCRKASTSSAPRAPSTTR